MRILLITLVAACALFGAASAADEEKVYGSSEEIFSDLREQRNPEYFGGSVEQALEELPAGGEVDEGTYPPSEIWDRDFDLRREKPEKPRLSGRTFFKISDDDISGIEKFEKELELNVSYGDWTSYFRFSDVNTYAENDDPFRWEKAQVRYKKDNLKVTAGSFSALFGRGLSLNVFEERTLDFDNELEGIKVEYEFDDVDVTVLAGQHKELERPTSPNLALTRHHSQVAAARVDFPVTEDVRAGLNLVDIKIPDPLYREEDRRVVLDYELLGQDVQVRLGPVTFYGEAVQLSHPENPDAANLYDQEGATGRGYYANMVYSGSNYSVNLEFKDYDLIEHPFIVLPPVRQFQQQASARANDAKGYGAQFSWSPFEDGSHFVFNYGQDNRQLKGEMYREASVIYSSPAASEVTWVAEAWDVFVGIEEQRIYRLTLNRQLDEDWTATTFLERERWKSIVYEPYVDYIVEGELAYKSVWNLIYTHEQTGDEFADPALWGLWEVKYKPDETQEWNLVYGSRREGLVCSGGICRVEPAFDGLRLDYLWRF